MSYTNGLDKPSDYFNTVLYTGNGSARTITGVGFQPDWVWVKDRSSANYHYLYDSVRGNNLNLFSNDASAEVNVTTGQNGGGIGSQASDGFNIVSGLVNTNNVNTSGNLYASWNWLGANGTASNTDGSITSTVSANTTSGFSIVSYTGTGASATVGHGLNVAPSFLITKNRSGTDGWIVHTKAITATTWWDTRLLLASTATAGSGAGYLTAEPTSTLFAISSFSPINASGNNYITYCFAEKKGFSKFGSYTGNGNADGTFVYTGFKPAFVIAKASSVGGYSWAMSDNKRNPFNQANNTLYANASDAEYTSLDKFDLLSNGFKLKSVYGNTTGDTYIYMAFAENPLVGTNNIPATAR